MEPDEIRRRLIKNGIEKIKDSHPHAEINDQNVFTEYSLTFRAILLNTKGTTTEEVDNVVDKLIEEIEEKNK